MASLIHQYPAPSLRSRVIRSDGARPDDITELIMADHRRLRRLRWTVEDAARYGNGPDWTAAAWQRLAGLLDVHIRAEEEICYLPAFGSSPHGIKRIREALARNEDIRRAIGEARLQPDGSAPWWRAAGAVLTAATEHIDSEESQAISGWMLSLATSRRRELGRLWNGFISD